MKNQALRNDLLLRSAHGLPTERVPVWLMRQAGRILPEYRELRAKAKGFKALVNTPELAATATLQPVDHLDVDAAIIFSDILVIPEAMGLPYQMEETIGPRFERVISSEDDIRSLTTNVVESLSYVVYAITLSKEMLENRVPLIGFAGAPWTIFSYMTEGKGTKTFSVAKKWLYANPVLSHQLLEKICEATFNYLKAQIIAGVDIVQIFDSWAGVLSPTQYEEFSLKYIRKICDRLRTDDICKETPIIVFAKGAFFARRELGKLNCNVVGLDWNMDICESRELIGTEKVLQGNLDPCALYADFKFVKRKTEEMLLKFGGKKHIANLGHGLYPDTPLDNVKCFIETVKGFRIRE